MNRLFWRANSANIDPLRWRMFCTLRAYFEGGLHLRLQEKLWYVFETGPSITDDLQEISDETTSMDDLRVYSI